MASFELTSPAFKHGGAIPAAFTCDGADQSPPLEWRNAPEGTKSFALIMDDPDVPDPAAPKRTWVHWVVWDIPPTVTALPPGASGRAMPAGSREGLNDSSERGYGGPCPPIGRHRYFHHVYALDRTLGELAQPTKAGLLRAMEGHVLATAELMGTYQRPGR
ncbi:MAG TPA: YbhB/YbcL family Raf kinase inhibitor-like protein [Gemmatimonadaceae bacterium]